MHTCVCVEDGGSLAGVRGAVGALAEDGGPLVRVRGPVGTLVEEEEDDGGPPALPLAGVWGPVGALAEEDFWGPVDGRSGVFPSFSCEEET